VDWLTAPFRYPFMQTALLTVVMVGVTCACIGVYVVLRRMAFIGDALAHTILPGIVVAFLGGWSLLAGALVAGVLTALGIGTLSRREAVREDTAIGVLFTAMFALGVLLISTTASFRDFTSILFGNILGVSYTDVAVMGVMTAVVLLTLLAFHKELELTSFDPNHAEVIGLCTDRLRYLLLVLLAFTVVMGIQAVGVILINALLVTPAAAATLLTDRLPRMMMLGSVIAVFSGVIGLYVSYYADVPSGAAIVLTSTAFFAVAWGGRVALNAGGTRAARAG
jgi:ABC-type Mn2+/Zn2+ transport system permease subunit